MLDRFPMDIPGTQRTELMEYCKMENVSLAILLSESKSENTLKLRLKSTVFHLLQIVDKRLNIMIDRLSAEVERKSMVQRRLS